MDGNIQLTGQVLDPSASSLGDGQQAPLVSGRGGEILTSELHGRFYHLAYRGRLFAARTSHAGAVLPVYTDTAYTFCVLNPANSGVNLELLRITVDVLAATEVVAALVLNYAQSPQLDVILAASPTAIAGGVVNTFLGEGAAPKSIAYSAATWTNQGDAYLCDIGGFMATAASPNVKYDIDGAIVVPPGTMIALTSATAAQTSAAMVTVLYGEIPV